MERHEAQPHTTLVLAVLFTGAFTMGCAEMLVVGLLDLIATDLGVSVPHGRRAVRDGHGTVDAAPGRESRGSRRAARGVAAGLGRQRRHRLGSLAGGVAIDVRGLHAAVLTGAVIAAVAVGAARLTSTLRPAAAAADAPEMSHLREGT